jgi:hypothetical protein
VWGIIGLGVGVALGLLLEFLRLKHKRNEKKINRDKMTEVVVNIRCTDDQKDMIEKILWEHYALGIGRVD